MGIITTPRHSLPHGRIAWTNNGGDTTYVAITDLQTCLHKKQRTDSEIAQELYDSIDSAPGV